MSARNPEELLISAVLRTGDYQTPAAHGMGSDLFHAYKEEWKWIESYIARHHRAPSKSAFKIKFPEFTIYKTDDVAHWCIEAKQRHSKTEFIQAVNRSLDLIDQGDVEAAARALHGRIIQIEATAGSQTADHNIFDDWQSTYQEVRARAIKARETGSAGIPTGIDTLDLNTGGLQGGWMCIIAARLGQGKTWTMIAMAYEALKRGHTVSYFSLEQTKSQIAMRMHNLASHLWDGGEVFSALDLIRGRNFDLKKYEKFLGDVKDIIPGTFIVNDSRRGRITPMSIAASIESKQPDIVFIDYLTLLNSGGRDWQQIAELSAGIQSIGQRYNVPIVAASQLNRTAAVGKEAPGAEHLTGSDAIGQDADLLITTKRHTARVRKMYLTKFRHGPDGLSWWYRFDPTKGIFQEINGSDAEKLMEEDQSED